ncbi:hypothetical protein MPTK1_4g11590 [Marchantia polymorpha subsp. ruderalis]|uniref:Uncharacterized protein n=2 Tax=Marchantia polymorpha TaxID=3197 RepID=A0AAF6B8V4_MARPO|nr:hypothetical protein MARPO_0011s0144 [Marchantia polymorpha]PTQ46475.1 hypothetical protein MARPO_0011s0144 [Marchantia polymorpha]BBN08438.1 hypothetical protein Mp_4g11590 [Marchantia polymorpha subsp. ruderalis]BBN08439.1 hypothetical protein Mp_4g11590 [Marchantia polymorpha subsp. ruderalis]|eukprot:PTQ46474.1 hypothetical protein MARPO_0011s0144 [Marchantia polymorpha]
MASCPNSLARLVQIPRSMLSLSSDSNLEVQDNARPAPRYTATYSPVHPFCGTRSAVVRLRRGLPAIEAFPVALPSWTIVGGDFMRQPQSASLFGWAACAPRHVRSEVPWLWVHRRSCATHER